MFKSFLRSVNTYKKPLAKQLNSITIYHNTDSTLSAHLLNKLNSYSKLPCTSNKYTEGNEGSNNWFNQGAKNTTKFNISLKVNQLLSYQDYLFILNNCANIHPDNKIIMEKVLKLNKTYDMEPLSPDSFNKLISNSNSSEPLIIDYSNNLIANDDKSFDRILANYLSCGIQNSSNIFLNTTKTNSNKHKYNHIIHPHVAEFADLF